MASKPRRFTIAINKAYCKGCEICVQICPKQVLALDDRQKASVRAADECTGCLNCEIFCPDFAIDVEELEEVSVHG